MKEDRADTTSYIFADNITGLFDNLYSLDFNKSDGTGESSGLLRPTPFSSPSTMIQATNVRLPPRPKSLVKRVEEIFKKAVARLSDLLPRGTAKCDAAKIPKRHVEDSPQILVSVFNDAVVQIHLGNAVIYVLLNKSEDHDDGNAESLIELHDSHCTAMSSRALRSVTSHSNL